MTAKPVAGLPSSTVLGWCFVTNERTGRWSYVGFDKAYNRAAFMHSQVQLGPMSDRTLVFALVHE